MRIIASKRNKQDGFQFHYCPKTQGRAGQVDCIECLGPVFVHGVGAGGGEIEQLEASYRIHCPHGEAVKAIVPSHVEDEIPANWGTDKFALAQYSVIEPKLDGARCIMLVTETGIRCFSRRNNRFGDQAEFTDNVPHIAGILLPGLAGTILDGEIIVMPSGASSSGNMPTGTLGATMSVVGADPEQAIETQKLSGWARVYVFDMPVLRGTDLIDKSLAYRRAELAKIWPVEFFADVQLLIRAMPSHSDITTPAEKARLYREFLATGAEGAVLKDPDAKYYDLRAQLKLIPHIALDVLVTGFELGTKGGKYANTVGALLCSVRDAETGWLREMCKVVPGSDATRAELFQRLQGKSPEEIAELRIIIWIEAKNWTKEYRLRHPKVKEYCIDRDVPTTVNFAQVERK